MMVWKRVSGAQFPAWMKDENRDHTTLTPKGVQSLQPECEERMKVAKLTPQ